MTVTESLLLVSAAVGALTLFGMVFVTAKAFYAYRAHDSRSMLLLSVGLLLALVAPTAVGLTWGVVIEPAIEPTSARPYAVYDLVRTLCRAGGVGALAASLYVRE